MESTCAYCGKGFNATRTRKSERPRECCSLSCAAKLGHIRKGNTGWPPDSEAWLVLQAGRKPFSQIVKDYEQAAITHGWPSRSFNSIAGKFSELGLSRRCTEENFNTGALAKILGIRRNRIQHWQRRGLRYKKVGPGQIAIRKADVRAFLRSKPGQANGISVEALSWLFDDQGIAERLTKAVGNGLPRPVVCLTTGATYPSLAAAGRAVYSGPNSIKAAIYSGGISAGCRWAYADELEKKA